MIDSNVTSDEDVRAMQYIKDELDQDIESQYIDEKSLLIPHSDTDDIVEKINNVDDECLDYFYCLVF